MPQFDVVATVNAIFPANPSRLGDYAKVAITVRGNEHAARHIGTVSHSAVDAAGNIVVSEGKPRTVTVPLSAVAGTALQTGDVVALAELELDAPKGNYCNARSARFIGKFDTVVAADYALRHADAPAAAPATDDAPPF